MSSTRTTPRATGPANAAGRLPRLRERRETRAARARLRAEVASYYSNPAERVEWEAILARHTDEQVAELAALLR